MGIPDGISHMPAANVRKTARGGIFSSDMLTSKFLFGRFELAQLADYGPLIRCTEVAEIRDIFPVQVFVRG
jgi:hypothetical protein